MKRPRIKRLFQFSLRTMLVVMVVLSVWLGITVRKARQQKAAVEWVRALGGVVVYEYMIDDSYSPVTEDIPFLSSWFCRVLGVDYFYQVRMVVIVSDEISNTDVKHLTHLSGLESLHLGSYSVSDLGVAHLAEISTLQHLFVPDDQITESCIARLRTRLPHCDVNFERGDNKVSGGQRRTTVPRE